MVSKPEPQRAQRNTELGTAMAYPIKKCVVCGEEFELKPGKPGFANRCPSCSEEDSDRKAKPADVLKTDKGANAARREAMKNLLYRKDS
jgi:predicted RNA-binding Zn-ribbon protein involved in translation (DUF1610 family)